MNILLISGSPRKNGNTNTIVQQVAEKLKANHAVEVCRIPDIRSIAVWAVITVRAFWMNPAVCRRMM